MAYTVELVYWHMQKVAVYVNSVHHVCVCVCVCACVYVYVCVCITKKK